MAKLSRKERHSFNGAPYEHFDHRPVLNSIRMIGTYVSERVQVVVGQFQLLEGDELPHPVRPGGGRVRVHVEPAGHGGLCLPGNGPESKRRGHTVTPRACTATGEQPCSALKCAWKYP